MTYSTTITRRNAKVRWLLKIAGVPYYFATWGESDGSDTWDDSAYGNTHGELPIYPILSDPSVSGGSLDYRRHLVTDTTVSVRLQDNSTLRTLFGRRQTPGTYSWHLEVAVDDDDTTITTGDSSKFAVDDYFHCRRECMQVASLPSNGEDLDVTGGRGMLGTTAMPHPANATIAKQPLYWLGRKAWLVLGIDNEGTWEYEDPYKTLFLDASPSCSAGQWELRCSISLNHFERPFYTGFKDVPVRQAKMYESSGRHYIQLTLEEPLSPITNANLTDSGAAKPALWVEGPESAGAFELVSKSDTGPYVQCYSGSRNILQQPGPSRRRLRTHIETNCGVSLDGGASQATDGLFVRLCWPFVEGFNDANPAQCALAVMLSDGIVSSTGTWNVMPGVAETEDTPRARGGAGLASAEVDTGSWELAGSFATANGGFVVGGEHEESLIKFLTEDVAPVLGGYVSVNDGGQLSFVRYEAAAPTATADLTVTDANSLGDDNAIDDEASRIGCVDVGSRYNWSTRKFRERHVAHWMDLKALYDEGLRKLEINSRFSDIGYESALTAFDSYYARWGDGALRHTIVVPWSGHLIVPGDTVAYTNARLPDMEGSQGISAGLYEVTAVAPDIGRGTVRLEIVRRPTCKAIAPVAIIDSAVSGGTYEYYIENLGLPGIDWTVSGVAADYWAAGFMVSFVDGETGALLTLSGEDEFEIATVFDGGAGTIKSLEFTSCPDLTAGDLVIFATYATCSSVTATNAQGLTQTDYAFLDTAAYNPSGAAHMWG